MIFRQYATTLPAALPLKLPRARAAVLCAYLLFAAACGWGAWRLQHAQVEYVEGVTIRVVQANIAQHHKWNPESQMQGLQEHVRLTRLPGIEQVSHVIWPETAVPYLIQDGGTLAARLGEILPQHTVLITGALSAKEEGKAREITNSIVALDHRGAIVGAYDKYKLVPFGEFLPFRSLIPAAWLTPVGASDFASGPGPQTLKWPGLPPLRPLICYEAIFPAEAGAEGERPQLLLNLTNDAWFGLSSGPYQHFEMARMRAVEEGLPLVRVANTGISAVIDAYGRVESRMELGQQGIVDFKLQKSQLYDTTYEISKKIVLLFLISVTILLILWNRKPPSN